MNKRRRDDEYQDTERHQTTSTWASWKSEEAQDTGDHPSGKRQMVDMHNDAASARTRDQAVLSTSRSAGSLPRDDSDASTDGADIIIEETAAHSHKRSGNALPAQGAPAAETGDEPVGQTPLPQAVQAQDDAEPQLERTPIDPLLQLGPVPIIDLTGDTSSSEDEDEPAPAAGFDHDDVSNSDDDVGNAVLLDEIHDLSAGDDDADSDDEVQVLSREVTDLGKLLTSANMHLVTRINKQTGATERTHIPADAIRKLLAGDKPYSPPQTASDRSLPFGARECPVCLERISEAAATVCGHVFCFECINAVIEAHGKCPICRTPLVSVQVFRLFA